MSWNSPTMQKTVRSVQPLAIRPAGQVGTGTGTDWWSTGSGGGAAGGSGSGSGGAGASGTGSTTGTGGDTGVGAGLDTSGLGGQQNQNNQPNWDAIARIFTSLGTLGSSVTGSVLQTEAQRDIAHTQAATQQAIATLQAQIAQNPNSAQIPILRDQLAAMQQFAAMQAGAGAQQTRWLEYALLGVLGVAAVGTVVYVVTKKGGGGKRSVRKNPVVGTLKRRHFVSAAHLREQRARKRAR